MKHLRVEDFIETQKGTELEVFLILHPWLIEKMGLKSKMRYGIPFYDTEKWLCYLNPLKKGSFGRVRSRMCQPIGRH